MKIGGKKMFDTNSIYIVGVAKSQLNNPITYQFGRFVIGFVVNKDTGQIITCCAATALPLTNEFLQSIFCNKNIIDDNKLIQEEIQNRYIGASQKAIIFAYRDALKRFKIYQIGDYKSAIEYQLD